jgi:hypothetical protein
MQQAQAAGAAPMPGAALPGTMATPVGASMAPPMGQPMAPPMASPYGQPMSVKHQMKAQNKAMKRQQKAQ